MLHITAPQHHAYRRPHATRRPPHAPAPPGAIRRGSFLEHTQQFPEVYPAPATPTTVSATPCSAIHPRPRALRTPGTLLAAAVCFLAGRRAA